MDISLEAWNTQDTMHISNGAQEEESRGLRSWKSSVQQCQGLPGQGHGNRWIGKQGEGRGLMGLLESGEPGKGKLFEM